MFDGGSCAPAVLFNERVFCGLARGLAGSGRLPADGMRLALANLARLTRIAKAMVGGDIHMIATAAVRDASNGAEFVSEIEKVCGQRARVLTGAEEARLGALGVAGSFIEADGFVGDLGGGSLELAAIDRGKPGAHATFALGSLRMLEISGGDRKKVRDAIEAALGEATWLSAMRDRTMYPVGGAWRTIARLHMESRRYPLHVIHGYIVPRKEMQDFAKVVERLSDASLEGIATIPKRRQETLPLAALALGRVLKAAKPRNIVFSAFGLREGFLLDRLAQPERLRDPLIVGAERLAERNCRFPEFAEPLTRWIHPLFGGDDPAQTRLRRAACHLADIAWNDHPDYRALQAFNRVLHSSLVGVEHAGRAFLATVVFVRYGGDFDHPELAVVQELLSKAEIQRAHSIGLALRLAYTLTGGSDALLARATIGREGEEICLKLAGDGAPLAGEAVERHLDALVRATDAKRGRIVI